MEQETLEYHRNRVMSHGIRASDITWAGLLTTKEIASISEDCVFDWIKQGCWKRKHFIMWCNARKDFIK